MWLSHAKRIAEPITRANDNKKITLLVVYYYCLALPKGKPVIVIICHYNIMLMVDKLICDIPRIKILNLE